MLTQANVGGINPNWILLDSQSTISVFKNASMLTNIRRSEHVLRALTNGGHQDSNMVGDFPNLGEVWYNKHSIANILSLAHVRKVCRVTMDTAEETALFVHQLDGSIMKFVEHDSGLYIFDPNDDNESSTNVSTYTMLSTVAKQKSMFSRREIEAADRARALYRMIGRPAEAEFQSILTRNLIRNCPVTPDDAKRALMIYGPDIAVIKGKLTRSGAAPCAPTFVAMDIPPPVLEQHRRVTLCMDFFFVQGLPFFHTISRDIGFRTVSAVTNRNKATILNGSKAAIRLYEARGLTVCDIHADNEFECIREDVCPTDMNIVPTDSHVGEVERSIRTIKERLRSSVHGLPFKRLPKLMVRELASDAVRCLNQFPWKNGVSDTMSPTSIITGKPTPDFQQMRIEFGSYAQVFEENNPTNTPKARSLGAIALTPTGNAQGDYWFLSLATGARISRHKWVELPITATAIARVEALAIHEGQPLIQDSGLVVEWRPGQEIDDDEYDANYNPDDAVPPPDADLLPEEFDPILADELADLVGLNRNNNEQDVHAATGTTTGQEQDEDDDHSGTGDDAAADEDDVEPDASEHGDHNDPVKAEAEEGEDECATDHVQGAETEVATKHGNNQGTHDEAEEENEDEPGAQLETVEESDNTEQEAVEQRVHNLRERGRGSASRFNAVMDDPHNTQSYDPPMQFVQKGTTGCRKHRMTNAGKMKFVFAYVMTQMSANAGLKKHGRAAEAALMKEFAQLEDLTVFEPLYANGLTKEQKGAALRAITLLKEKRDGRLKGRTVADGRPQRGLYDKSETASPTVSSDALTMSIIVDAHEKRDVATADVAGAYLKADMPDFVVMKFTGKTVDILCEMNPDYLKFVAIENGKKVVYVRLIKALYGCVKSALLWYELFTGTLKGMGFKLNPYDSCIANCMIEGKQCTIAWYVDDNKISHVDPDVVTRIIEREKGVVSTR
jgi:hypothetical protein